MKINVNDLKSMIQSELAAVRSAPTPSNFDASIAAFDRASPSEQVEIFNAIVTRLASR